MKVHGPKGSEFMMFLLLKAQESSQILLFVNYYANFSDFNAKD